MRFALAAALVLSLAAVLYVVLGSGGSGAAKISAADRKACSALLGALPTTVADQPRRRTSGSDFSAEWGKRAIVLRCGVGRPDDYDKFAGCQTTNGVDWFVPERIMADQDADVVMTTVGRSPAVEVRVPASYRPATAPMVDLAEAIKRYTREVAPCS